MHIREKLAEYRAQLIAEEKSETTVGKYLHDASCFLAYLDDAPISKETVIGYKEQLREGYKTSSANSMLAAVNHYLRFLGKEECRVRQYKIQRRAFRETDRELNREEYLLMVRTAREGGDERLALLLQTVCATGIRISELPFVTAEAVAAGQATVTLKGKTRTVLLPGKLCKRLRAYLKKKGIVSGAVFVTRSGKPLDRSNIWKSMKKLAQKAEVTAKKIFPHNLRHLFARQFYSRKRDISMLADVLGHSSIETTRIYLATTDTQHEKIIEQLGLI